MPAKFLDAASLYPMHFANGEANRGLVHLSRAIDHPNISVGDFTYASTFDPPADWAARLAPYTYAGAPERLRIGRFCQIADRALFITASANHPLTGISTYPFAIFDHELFAIYKEALADLPDTTIGNDVWVGHGATILPGAIIGDGVVIGAGAVVGGRVPDYAIVAGNPSRVVRMRFSPAEVETLLDLAWWDWPAGLIETAIPALAAGDVSALARLRPVYGGGVPDAS